MLNSISCFPVHKSKCWSMFQAGWGCPVTHFLLQKNMASPDHKTGKQNNKES